MSVSQVSSAVLNFNSIGDNTAIAAVAGKALRIVKMLFVLGSANDTNITFKDGASTSLSGALPFLANGSLFLPLDLVVPYFITSPGNAFIINLSAGLQLSGTVYYMVTNV